MVDVTKNVNGICDYDVSLDGAWQRRGYSSIHGFVSAIERITDKVIDVEVLTDVVLSYCYVKSENTIMRRSCVSWLVECCVTHFGGNRVSDFQMGRVIQFLSSY